MSSSRWELVEVGSIAEVVGGGTPKTSTPEYWDGPIGWLTPRDLSGYDARYISEGARSISASGLNESSARLLPKGTVLVSSRAPIGYVAIASTPLATNQGFKSLVLKEGYLPEFYFYVMKTKKSEMESVAGGSTFKEISGRVMKTIRVPVPPLEEQRAVAEVLGALDDRIEWCTTGTMAAEKIVRISAEHWESLGTVALAAVASLDRTTVAAGELREKFWTHYSIPSFDSGQEPRVEWGSDIKSGKFRVPTGSVLVSKLNPTWPRVWLPNSADGAPAICSTEFMPLLPNEAMLAGTAVLWASLLSNAFNSQLRERASGSTGSHQRVRPEDILSSRVFDQTNISEAEAYFLQALSEQVRALRAERRALTDLRDVLVSRLVSGEMLIPDPQALLGPVG